MKKIALGLLYCVVCANALAKVNMPAVYGSQQKTAVAGKPDGHCNPAKHACASADKEALEMTTTPVGQH